MVFSRFSAFDPSLGTQLLDQAVQDVMIPKGIKHIYLHVQTSNIAAYEFYKKHGFVELERLDNYYKQDIDPPHCFYLKKTYP